MTLLFLFILGFIIWYIYRICYDSSFQREKRERERKLRQREIIREMLDEKINQYKG